MIMTIYRHTIMAQKNDTATLMMAFFLTTTLVGGGIWGLGQRWLMDGDLGLLASIAGSPSPTPPSRVSLGETILILADAPPEKQAGASAYRAGQHSTAIAQFQATLQKHRNDPETLIYAQALHSSSFAATGAGGKIAFSPTGDRVGAPVLVQVQSGGPTSYNFVPIPSP